MFSTFNLPLVALLPFIGAIFAYWSNSFNRIAPAWVALMITLTALVLLTPSAVLVFDGETLIQSWSWIPSIGLEFAFRLDGLALLFALLILIIGVLVIIYARYYFTEKDCMGRFFAYLLLFMGSMLGIVISENIIQLVFFWELTSLSSFLLISYWKHKEAAREGAIMAFVITGGGGLALLGGVIMLGNVVGSYNLSDVLLAGDLVRSHDLYVPILVLILIGAFTKSAQFPFHFWLPHAMEAPTPASAYLHSATMVKAGIFLLARFFPVLSGSAEWTWLVAGTGLITLLLGAYVALFKHDLKGLLAYSTISHLGLITLLFGLGTPTATVAAIFHIINHATFKASLFMVAGIIDHEAGTRDMRKLNGLLRYMPHTAVLAMIATAAMAGIPLLNGFLSKEMFFEQILVYESTHPLVGFALLIIMVAVIFSVAYSLRFIHDAFLNSKPIALQKIPQEPYRIMKIPVDFLVIICLAVGIFPMFTVAPILAVAVAGTLQSTPPEYSLLIWHGFNLPLAMSVTALVLGVLLYFQRQRLFVWYEHRIAHRDARILYRFILKSMTQLSTTVTAAFDKRSLQNSISWVIIMASIAGIAGFMATSAPLLGARAFMPVDGVSVLSVAVILIAGAMTVILHRKRLISITLIGVIGLVVSLIFIKFSAPDLALTQLSVEVVTTVSLLLALYFLPKTDIEKVSRLHISRDIVVALLAGISVTALSLAVLSRDFAPISEFFVANSIIAGGGANVVNVVLIDFRATDTLGEITVLALSGLGIYALLHGVKIHEKMSNKNPANWSKVPYPEIMQTLARVLLPLMFMVAAFIFIRGHNLPGGGFIAGLIASAALIVQYIAHGISWTGERLKVHMYWLIATGLFIATLTGTMSLAFGYPFMTTTYMYLTWPIVGEFEVTSAIAFDLGVFFVVVGATVMSLVQLGKLHKLHKKQEVGQWKG